MSIHETERIVGEALIRVYYRKPCTASQKANSWFQNYGIEAKYVRIEKISETDLLEILSLSEGGFAEITKKSRTSSKKTLKAIMGLNKLTFKEALAFVTEHPECLITPIIIGKNKMLVGYNEVEMRKFIPRYLRD